jgi:3-oxoacyl-[acyl-carrier protein] reductase
MARGRSAALIEQPLAGCDWEGMRALCDGFDIAIMADEELTGPVSERRLAEAGAADVFALKIAQSGGLAKAQEVAEIAASHGLARYGGTILEGGVGTIASAHLFACLPDLVWHTELFGPLLLAEGFRVCLADLDEAALAAIAKELASDRLAVQRLDVTDRAQFEAATEALSKRWGGVGVLVNNAALTRTTPLFEISAEEFDAVTAVALKGTFLGCQALGLHMREAGYGRIVNIASLAGQNGGAATGAHYAAAKGGIITLTKVFARDLAAHGVTVNAISPGPLDLDSVRALLPPDKLEAVIKTIPTGTLGDPDTIARLVALLADPQAASATGATYDINGGLYLR